VFAALIRPAIVALSSDARVFVSIVMAILPAPPAIRLLAREKAHAFQSGKRYPAVPIAFVLPRFAAQQQRGLDSLQGAAGRALFVPLMKTGTYQAALERTSLAVAAK